MVSTYSVRTTRIHENEREDDREIKRVKTLARVLDHGLVDPLIGLVAPGIGDLVGSMLGMYAVVVAVRRRVSPIVIARMLLNLLFDFVIGIVPILGDMADFAFKANERNVALLVDRDARGGRASAKDWAVVVAVAVLWIAIVGLVIYGVGRLFGMLWNA